jgi:hypothetical protein
LNAVYNDHRNMLTYMTASKKFKLAHDFLYLLPQGKLWKYVFLHSACTIGTSNMACLNLPSLKCALVTLFTISMTWFHYLHTCPNQKPGHCLTLAITCSSTLNQVIMILPSYTLSICLKFPLHTLTPYLQNLTWLGSSSTCSLLDCC